MCALLTQNTLVKQTRNHDYTPDFYSSISATAIES